MRVIRSAVVAALLAGLVVHTVRSRRGAVVLLG